MVIINRLNNVLLEDMTDSEWIAGTYEEVLIKYNASSIDDFPTVHAVDLLSIATQSDPQPLKDVPSNLTEGPKGVYLGESSLVKSLQDDRLIFKIEGKQEIRTSRWIMLNVNQQFRSTKHDHEMQHHMKHGEATIKCGSKSVVPSITYPDTPILAIRTYTAPYTAVVNLAYDYHHGAHRCNVLQDLSLAHQCIAIPIYQRC